MCRVRYQRSVAYSILRSFLLQFLGSVDLVAWAFCLTLSPWKWYYTDQSHYLIVGNNAGVQKKVPSSNPATQSVYGVVLHSSELYPVKYL
jgi:hypothetical protein